MRRARTGAGEQRPQEHGEPGQRSDGQHEPGVQTNATGCGPVIERTARRAS